MTCVTKTINCWWRLESKPCLKLQSTPSLEKIRPCDIYKLIKTWKFRNSCGIEGIQYECLRHLPRSLIRFTYLFNHCLRLLRCSQSWKDAKIIALQKSSKDPKCPHNLRPINLLSTTGKLFETNYSKNNQIHIKERDLLNGSQFDFRTCHSLTLQCMMLTDHVTIKFQQ
jgi:hypothetical protein